MSVPDLHQLHVYIDGTVQGVGFRHATLLEAQSRALSGWVRNLADGRVEALFQGPRDALEEMLRWCQRGPHLSEVREVKAEWRPVEHRHEKFRIAFSAHS